MNNIIRRVWNQNRMVNIEALYGMAFQAEDGGHTFEISGINDANETVSLSGTVAGVFMRPDGTDVALTGTESDGVVSVTLSDACYAVAGRFGLTIFVTADNKKTCVYACIGTVAQTSYGTVAGDTPQDVVDLINTIEAAVATIPADYTDLMAAFAPTYSNTALYAEGSYVWYDGKLYRCISAITTAESWTAAHWTQVALGDDVADLKSQIKDVYDGNLTRSLKGTEPVLLGNYSVGQTVDLSPLSTTGTNHYTILISDVVEGDVFQINLVDGNTARPWAFLDVSYNLLSMSSGPYAYNTKLTAPANSAYLILQCGAAYLSNASVVRDLSLRYLEKLIDDEIQVFRDEIDELQLDVDVTNLNFVPGGISTTGAQTTELYRVVSSEKISFKFDTSLRLVASGYRYYVITFAETGSVLKRAGWISDGAMLVIPKGTPFKVCVARVTEDTTETNNVAEFSAITAFKTWSDFQHRAKIDAVYNGKYTPLLHLTEPVLLGNYSIGQTVDITPMEEVGGQHCTMLIDGVIPGEKYALNVTDGSAARPWAFLDIDHKLLAMASNAYAQDVTITAPSNAQYLIIQVGLASFANANVSRMLNLISASSGVDDGGIVMLNNKALLTEKLIETRYCNVNNKKNLTLFHFSDIHGSTDNIQRILDLMEAFPDYADSIIHTGDSVTTYYSDANPFASVGGADIMNAIGNHDCWIQGDTWPHPYNATAQQAYEKFISPFISNWGVTSPGANLCYYFKDYADYGIRLIVLDCIHYDTAQETWLSTALSGAKTNNYSVIIANHYPPQSGIAKTDCTFTSYGKSISPVSTPSEGTQIERLPESAYTVVDNYMTGGGKFICWIAGHTHFDYVGTVTGHANQLVVIIDCGVVDYRYGTDKRINGTKTQDCVNVIGFDTDNHIIKVCRVGISMDWFGRVKNLLSIDYDTKTMIANS